VKHKIKNEKEINKSKYYYYINPENFSPPIGMPSLRFKELYVLGDVTMFYYSESLKDISLSYGTIMEDEDNIDYVSYVGPSEKGACGEPYIQKGVCIGIHEEYKSIENRSKPNDNVCKGVSAKWIVENIFGGKISKN
jgi:hypothetical protein